MIRLAEVHFQVYKFILRHKLRLNATIGLFLTLIGANWIKLKKATSFLLIEAILSMNYIFHCTSSNSISIFLDLKIKFSYILIISGHMCAQLSNLNPDKTNFLHWTHLAKKASINYFFDTYLSGHITFPISTLKLLHA